MPNLVVAETRLATLRSSTLSAVSLARQMGGETIGLVIGAGVGPAATELSRYLPSVLVVDDARLPHYLAETFAPLVARIARERGAQAVVATATATGKDLMPRVAALLSCGMASDVAAVLGPRRFRRPIAAGNALCDVEITTASLVVTARQTEFAAADPLPTPGTVATVAGGEIDPKGSSFVELKESRSERPDLADARIVVSGGRGMRNA